MKRTATTALAGLLATSVSCAGIVSAQAAEKRPALAKSAVADPSDSKTFMTRAAAKAKKVTAPGIGELKFVPLQPCRIIDTRGATGGPLVAGAVRGFDVIGTPAGQGGSGSNCGVPSYATAVTGTFTALSGSVDSFIKAWPGGAPEPVAVLFDVQQGSANTTNATIGISAAATNDFNVKLNQGQVNFLLDVTGYYAPAMYGIVNANGTVAPGSSRLDFATRVSAGVYNVDFSNPVVGCVAHVTPTADQFIAYAFVLDPTNASGENDEFFVNTETSNGTDTDAAFQITVTC